MHATMTEHSENGEIKNHIKILNKSQSDLVQCRHRLRQGFTSGTGIFVHVLSLNRENRKKPFVQGQKGKVLIDSRDGNSHNTTYICIFGWICRILKELFKNGSLLIGS